MARVLRLAWRGRMLISWRLRRRLVSWEWLLLVSWGLRRVAGRCWVVLAWVWCRWLLLQVGVVGVGLAVKKLRRRFLLEALVLRVLVLGEHVLRVGAPTFDLPQQGLGGLGVAVVDVDQEACDSRGGVVPGNEWVSDTILSAPPVKRGEQLVEEGGEYEEMSAPGGGCGVPRSCQVAVCKVGVEVLESGVEEGTLERRVVVRGLAPACGRGGGELCD
jgi:hypothetical protein